MATLTKGRTFVSGEVVTPTKLNTLVDSATISGITDADISASAAIADTKLAPIATAGKVSGSAITSGTIGGSTNVSTTGTIAATSFTGSGSSLTGIVGIPSGAILPFAMNSAPSGWLAANGTAVSRTTYAALFAAISTTYGVGDGSTTFTLPDLRASFVRGAGSDGTATSGTFGVKQADDLKSHTHTYTVSSGSGSYTNGGSPSYAPITAATTGATPAATSTETRPRNIAMLYCIKT